MNPNKTTRYADTPIVFPVKQEEVNRKRYAKYTVILRNFFLLCIGLLFQITPLFAAVSADKIKAAYIYQLTQFVTWPGIPTSSNTAFTICIFGKESINKELAPLNKRRKGMHLINVRQLGKIQDISGCHILYIAKSEQHQLQAIFKKIRNKPVLTISSIPGFTTSGGIIGFTISKNRVRLEINRSPARRADIKLSAKLLEVASVVRNDAPGEVQP